MVEIIIFLLILLAFVSMAFWEAYAEGEAGGAARAVGPQFKLFGLRFKAYHLILFCVFIPLLLSLTLIGRFSWHLFKFVAAGYFFGLVIEDFLWFVVNPKWPFSHWNSRHVDWYSWWKIGKFEIPSFYIPAIIIGILLLTLIK